MLRKLLQYASGLQNELRNSSNLGAESAGGINVGLSMLAFVSTIFVVEYAGSSLKSLLPWISAGAVFVVYFFVFRLVFGSSLSFEDSVDAKISFSGLSRRIPHIIVVALMTSLVSHVAVIKVLEKEIDYQISIMQLRFDVNEKNDSSNSEGAIADAPKGRSVFSPGYITRVEIANKINPKASTTITVFFMLVGLAPIFIRSRK